VNAQAQQLFEKAIGLDLQYAEAYAGYGFTHFFDWFYRWSPDPIQSQERAFQAAQQAVALDDSLPIPHQVLGQLYLWKKQHEQAIVEAERTVAVVPNDADSYLHLGNILTFVGRLEEAVELIKQAMRLNPRYPSMYLVSLAIAYRVAGRYEEALVPLQRAFTFTPHYLQARVNLAMCYAELNRVEEAQAEAAEVLRLSPTFSLNVWRQSLPFKDPAVIERMVAALRKAGLK
jgi:tetratricopeptide (TPR) repeat protein